MCFILTYLLFVLFFKLSSVFLSLLCVFLFFVSFCYTMPEGWDTLVDSVDVWSSCALQRNCYDALMDYEHISSPVCCQSET